MVVHKRLRRNIFGKEQVIGKFPSILHTDFISLVNWIVRSVKNKKCNIRDRRRRGDKRVRCGDDVHPPVKEIVETCGIKPPKLSCDKFKELEQAMLNDTAGSFNSIEELFAGIEKWFIESRDQFAANSYYDLDRAAGYDLRNKVSQPALTKRAAECLHNENVSMVLDVACGSGLSSQSFVSKDDCFCIGIDSSESMLNLCVSQNAHPYFDVVRSDMEQPLPFRKNAFDATISISAIHYLKQPKVFFSRVHQTLLNKQFVAQFFGDTPEQEGEILDAAASIFKKAVLMEDQPYRNKSKRTYLCAYDHNRDHDPKPCKIHKGGKTCFLEILKSLKNSPDEWLQNEHLREARKILRTYKHNKSLVPETLALDMFKACGTSMDQPVPPQSDLSACIPLFHQ
uniref:Methyltransferase domain-containing protein n=1 Tax=Mucochytrium quahogii TaxID=96639 RepID=A0A7S2WS89_9STRA|mmetsp:Transcript_39782/g.64626  ORF Transcript_39782/g.64626 Transcript_39782/m.64626 type:complete len:397 (+) Transcript_39782:56-1246(+)